MKQGQAGWLEGAQKEFLKVFFPFVHLNDS